MILENDVIIPLFLMDRTNVIRNIYASEHKNQSTSLVLDGKIDPLADALSECLNKCELENYKQVLYSLGKIDLILIIDDTMILIECKHSLQPASVYEMRTTFDHVQKASKQLSRALDHHKNGKLYSRCWNASRSFSI